MHFIVNETPNIGTILGVGAQHTVVVLMLVIYAVIVGTELGMTDSQLRGFVSLDIVIMGFATLIQSLPSRFGAGQLVIHKPNTISMVPFIAVAAKFGLGAVAGGVIVASFFMVVFARILPKLRPFFPPEIAGVLLVLLGLSLVEGGVLRSTEFDGLNVNPNAMIISGITLGTIIFCSVWITGKIRMFAVIIGLITGLLSAILLGEIGKQELDIVLEQPIFSLPFHGYSFPIPKFVIAAIIPIVLIEILSSVGSIGTGVALDKMSDDQWRRTDMSMISRLITCQGFFVFLNGLTGTLSISTSSANVGLVYASGVAARKVGTAAGLMLIALAFLPQVATSITEIPGPIVGAILIYTASYMVVAGMELILSRMLNNRRMFVVGLSVIVGMTIMVLPNLVQDVPDDFKPILASGLTMGILTGIFLNMLFRLGISQRAEMELVGPLSNQNSQEFLEDCGRTWGARREVIIRAGSAISEALDTLKNLNLVNGLVKLTASFDEFNVFLTLGYVGKKIELVRTPAPDPETLLAEGGEDAMDAAMRQVSMVLLLKLADRIRSEEKGDSALLHLQFEH